MRSWIKNSPQLITCQETNLTGKHNFLLVLWCQVRTWSQALSRFYYIWHIFGQGGSYKRVQQPVTGWERYLGLSQNMKERRMEEGGSRYPIACSKVLKMAVMVYAIATSDRRWLGYHFARSAGFWPCNGMLEVWIEVQINTWVSSTLTDPPGCGHVLHPFSPRLGSQRKSNLAKAQRTTGRRAHPLLLSQLLPSFISVSGLLLSGVKPRPCGLFSHTPLSNFSFTVLCFLPLLSPLEPSLKPFSLPE